MPDSHDLAMRKRRAAVGTAVMAVGPSTAVGVVPWLLTRWQVRHPVPVRSRRRSGTRTPGRVRGVPPARQRPHRPAGPALTDTAATCWRNCSPAACPPGWCSPPTTTDPQVARTWLLGHTAFGIEGVVAKRVDQPYRPGVRGWQKLRTRLTDEAVIG